MFTLSRLTHGMNTDYCARHGQGPCQGQPQPYPTINAPAPAPDPVSPAAPAHPLSIHRVTLQHAP